jgi:hypothetical protein
VKDASGEPVAGITVMMNATEEEAEGVRFFYPDPVFVPAGAYATGESGRFCVYNVEPRLMELVFAQDLEIGKEPTESQLVGGIAIPFMSGSHLEEDIFLGQEGGFKASIASVPVNSDSAPTFEDSLASLGGNIVEVQLLGLGDVYSGSLDSIDIKAELSDYRGRYYGRHSLWSQSSYLVSYNRGGGHQLSPFLESDFVFGFLSLLEDEGYEVNYNPDKKALLVDFGHQSGVSSGEVEIRVFNQSGERIQESWDVSRSAASTQEMFVNMEPGHYIVHAVSDPDPEVDGDERWLAVDTVAISGDDSLTYLQVGSGYLTQSKFSLGH